MSIDKSIDYIVIIILDTIVFPKMQTPSGQRFLFAVYIAIIPVPEQYFTE